MLIKVTEVGDIETKKEGQRRWKQIRIDYATDSKEDNYKILLDWANKQAFEDAQDCIEGEFYEVSVKKDGKYWNWVGITASDETEFSDKPSSKSYQKATPSGGTDWAAKNKLDADRFEFEKHKQGLIVRQSCIGYAIQALKTVDNYPQFTQIVELASKLEDAVMDGFVVTETTKVAKTTTKRAKPDPDAQSNASDPDDGIPY